MRTRVVPPYPSFAYVMSQIGDESHEIRAGSGGVPAKPTPRPYSKYDDNPFMVRACVHHVIDSGDLNGPREPCAVTGTNPRVAVCLQ